MGRRGARREAERVAGLAAARPPRAGGRLRRTPATSGHRAVPHTDRGVNDPPYRESWARRSSAPHGVNRTGASWCPYSPMRVRHPQVRGVPVELYRAARARPGDPVTAWAEVTGGPGRPRRTGRRGAGAPAPAVSGAEARHAPRGRLDLFNRNGLARPRGPFPDRKAEGPR